MLNYCYTVAAGRLAAHLAARGAHLAIGFFHGDKPGRFSLVYDALEPLRPLIDNYVFKFVDAVSIAATLLRLSGFGLFQT
jgi:CRISPR-associated protein Cas1